MWLYETYREGKVIAIPRITLLTHLVADGIGEKDSGSTIVRRRIICESFSVICE
jgi:hypothetical protein